MTNLLQAPGSIVQRYRPAPWWLGVLVIYALARIITTALILLQAHHQGANPWTGESPGYFDFANIWDAQWYQSVAGSGYPAQLPITDTGHVAQNAWAFLPGYPWVVAAVMFVTFLPWSVAAVLVSLGFSLAGALMFYRLMRLRFESSTSMFAVVLFCVAPLAPLMQLPYAESMYQALLVTALYLLLTHRYWSMLPIVVVMGFTRPSGLALALALFLHVVYRYAVRKRRAFPLRAQVAAITATGVSVLAGIAWPAVAALGTGDLWAYFDTELAWRSAYIGYQPLVPFTAWVQGAAWWFTSQLGQEAWLGYIILALVVIAFGCVLFTNAVKRLGVDLRFWLAAYALYLLAVFFPQSSTFRILMPMVPLLGAVAIPRSGAYRIVLVCLFIAAQWCWLTICWGYHGYDWTPP